jgi:hypothetical protein
MLVPIWEPDQTLTHCNAGSQATRAERLIAIRRVRHPPYAVTLTDGALTLYGVEPSR